MGAPHLIRQVYINKSTSIPYIGLEVRFGPFLYNSDPIRASSLCTVGTVYNSVEVSLYTYRITRGAPKINFKTTYFFSECLSSGPFHLDMITTCRINYSLQD